MSTSAEEAAEHFTSRSSRAAQLLAGWQSDPRYKKNVVPFVMGLVASVLYRATPTEVEAVCRRTEHALGEVKRSDAEGVREIVNWNPAFAIEHVLHYATERIGAVPTFQQFREFVLTDPTGSSMLLAPSKEAVASAVRSGTDETVAQAAMKWRIGNVYLAFLKESYALAVIRESGIDARYHPLADVLFRVDAWVDNVCLSIFVANAEFRTKETGRKPSSAVLLGDASLKHVLLEIPRRHDFGTVHLPDRSELAALAKSRLSPQSG